MFSPPNGFSATALDWVLWVALWAIALAAGFVAFVVLGMQVERIGRRFETWFDGTRLGRSITRRVQTRGW